MTRPVRKDVSARRAQQPLPVALSRRFTKGAVFVVLMIDSLANGLFLPLSMIYLVARSGATLAHIGALLSLAGLIALPLPLWTGRLADKVGARRVVIVGQVLQALGFGGYLIAASPTTVFVAATICSLGRSAFWSSIYGLISGLTDTDPDPRARERWFAAIGALRAAGYGVGALIAGIAVSVNSPQLYRSIITCSAALLLMACGLVTVAVPRHVAPEAKGTVTGRGYRVLWADRPYLALIALNTVFALCNILLSISLAPYLAHGLPNITWVVGPLLAMNTVVQALFQPTAVRLLRGIPRHVSLCIAGGLWASWSLATMITLFLPRALQVPCLVLAVLCYSAAQMIHAPVSNAISADAAPVDIRGRYLATFQYSFGIAGVIAPTLFSTLLGVGAAIPWLAISIAVTLAIPGMLILAPHLPKAALTGIRDGGRTEPVVS